MSLASEYNTPGAEPVGRAYVNGRYMPLSEATVDMMDRGFVRSDATYDVVHLWKGKFFRLDDYIERFYRSMSGVRLSIREKPEELKAIILECTRQSGLEDAFVQMSCTRGISPPGTRDPRLCENRLTVFAQPFVWISNPQHQEHGLRMIVANTLRIPSEAVDQRFKNFHWLDLTRGIYEAFDRDADVAVHPSIHGGLTEGAGFNVFMIKGRTLATPDTGIFEGMTRRTIIEIAPLHQLEVEIRKVTAEELASADEIFATSTAGGIMPVTTLDGVPIGNNGKPGPLTVALRAAYWDLHVHPDYTTDLNSLS